MTSQHVFQLYESLGKLVTSKIKRGNDPIARKGKLQDLYLSTLSDDNNRTLSRNFLLLIKHYQITVMHDKSSSPPFGIIGDVNSSSVDFNNFPDDLIRKLIVYLEKSIIKQ